jgi:hypothetical protein
MRFSKQIPTTQKKIGKKKSPTPYVYHGSSSNFIMFEEIDK